MKIGLNALDLVKIYAFDYLVLKKKTYWLGSSCLVLVRNFVFCLFNFAGLDMHHTNGTFY